LVNLIGYIFLLLLTSNANDLNLDDDSSRSYVASFFQSLADAGFASSEPFNDMAEEAATPGGLNEQTHRSLVQSGAYNLLLDEVDAIFKRLTNTDPAPRS